MKRIILAALLGITTITAASTASAGQDKMAVCHHGDDGIELISIADPALDAHIGHGDARRPLDIVVETSDAPAVAVCEL